MGYKAIEFQAIQWTEGKMSSVPMWLSDAIYKHPGNSGAVMRMGDEVHVWNEEEEVQVAKDGDYIIRSSEGHLFVSKQETFEKLFIKT